MRGNPQEYLEHDRRIFERIGYIDVPRVAAMAVPIIQPRSCARDLAIRSYFSFLVQMLAADMEDHYPRSCLA